MYIVYLFLNYILFNCQNTFIHILCNYEYNINLRKNYIVKFTIKFR